MDGDGQRLFDGGQLDVVLGRVKPLFQFGALAQPLLYDGRQGHSLAVPRTEVDLFPVPPNEGLAAVMALDLRPNELFFW